MRWLLSSKVGFEKAKLSQGLQNLVFVVSKMFGSGETEKPVESFEELMAITRDMLSG